MHSTCATARIFQIGKVVATSPILRIGFWPVEAKREANGRMAKMQSNSQNRGRGNDFADLKILAVAQIECICRQNYVSDKKLE